MRTSFAEDAAGRGNGPPRGCVTGPLAYMRRYFEPWTGKPALAAVATVAGLPAPPAPFQETPSGSPGAPRGVGNAALHPAVWSSKFTRSPYGISMTAVVG